MCNVPFTDTHRTPRVSSTLTGAWLSARGPHEVLRKGKFLNTMPKEHTVTAQDSPCFPNVLWVTEATVTLQYS